MTENGNLRENAVAERVNGIRKNEYLKGIKVETLEDARRILSQVIDLYNNDRPHSSIGYLTPNEIHENNLSNERFFVRLTILCIFAVGYFVRKA